MNQLNYRHNINSNTPSRSAIKKGRSRKYWIQVSYTVLASMFLCAGIAVVIGVCDYTGRGIVIFPWSFLFNLGGFVLGAIGFAFGIKGFQR